MTIEQAIALHRAGRFDEAEKAYRALLAANPRDADALHFCGVLRAQKGEFAAAIDLIGRSLEIDPEAPQAHFHFANALSATGRKAEALEHFQRAAALQPGYLQAQQGRIGALIDLGRAREALELCRRTHLPRDPQLADLRGRALMAAGAYGEALDAFECAMALKSDFVEAQYHRADALHALGRNEEALAGLARVVALKPDFAEAHLARGNVLLAMERPQEARDAIERALSLNPGRAEAHAARASAAIVLGRWREALEASDEALRLAPSHHEAQLHRSRALMELTRFEEAVAAAERAVALRPDRSECHNGRGMALLKLGRAEEALASFDRALELDPDAGPVLVNRGNALVDLNRMDEALDMFAQAIACNPDLPAAHCNRGNTFSEVKRYEEALECFDAAITLNPDHVEALTNRSDVLRELGRYAEALADADRAAALRPDSALAHNNRGAALLMMSRHHEALAALDRALSIEPDLVKALFNRSGALRFLGFLEQSLADTDRVMKLDPGHDFAPGDHFLASALLCDWRRRGERVEDLRRRASEGMLLNPWAILSAFDDPELRFKIAKRFAAPPKAAAAPRPSQAHERIRIAYLSPNFHNHPTGFQTVGIFERHDRTRFETFGICLHGGPDTPQRQRIRRAFEHFIEAEGMSDKQLAGLLTENGIDIAVDLAGYIDSGRTNALASRPVPVTVNYFGYPGTLGTQFIDYLIADSMVIPPGCERFYAEQVVRMPDCYYPAERASVAPPPRTELGLPESGFVFCSFNNTYKLTPDVFDVWMRLLKEVDGSVLWLFAEFPRSRANLRAEAQARGVHESRLIFADRVEHGAHLARLAAADLFLDSLPCNAHTTAADALACGVPVITVPGREFAGRVAASMLKASGLAELIACDLSAYERLCLELATSPEQLSAAKAKLKQAQALFDIGKLCCGLESAYETMIVRARNGLNPQSFSVKMG